MSQELFSTSRKNRLLKLIKNEPQLTRALVIYSILIGSFSLCVPMAIQSLVNSVLSTAMTQPVLLISFFVLIVMLFLVLLGALRKVATEYFSRRVFVTIAKGFLEKSSSSYPERFLEIGSINKVLASLLVDGIALALQAVLGAVLLASYHPFFLVYALVVSVLIYWGVRRFGEQGFKLAEELSNQKYEILKVSQAKEAGAPFGILSQYVSLRTNYFRVLFRQSLFFWLVPVMGTVTLLMLGSFLILNNQLSVGQLVAAELVTSAIFDAISKMGKFMEDIYDLNSSLKKIESEIGSPPALNEELLSSIQFGLSPSRKILQVNQWSWKLGLGFLVITSLVPWIQTAPGTGKVIAYSPNEREQAIDAPIEGRVKKWFVTEGARVKKGDPICELVDNDPNILTRLRSERDAILRRLEAAKFGAQTASKNIDRQSKLFEQGLSSERNVEQAKMEYFKQVTEESNAGAELSRLDVRLARQTNQMIAVPIDGTILRRASGQEGALFKSGEMLATLVPETLSRVVEVFVNGVDVPLVRSGQRVRLQFEGWPAIQFSGWPSVAIGTFGGVVKFVDAAISPNGLFRLVIEPESEAKWPPSEILRQGVRAKAWIQLNQVPLGFEIWRNLNGFPVSLPHENIYGTEPIKKNYDEKK